MNITKWICSVVLVLLTSSVHASVGQFLYETNRSFEAWLAGLALHSINVEGVDWRYYSRHTERENCLVLLHGFTAEASHWFRLARHIDSDRCLIVPDLPAFGESQYDKQGDYSIPRQTARLQAFLAAVKPDGKYHLVGSSMGGHIAVTYALEFPQRVASLVMINGGGVAPVAKSSADQWLESRGYPVFHISKRNEFYRLMETTMSDQPWMPDVVMDYLADRFIVRNERHMRVFSQIYGKNQVDSRLSEIQCPTYIIWGLDDKLVDASVGEKFTKGIKGARQINVEDAGHLPFLEKPSLIAGHLMGFLEMQRN